MLVLTAVWTVTEKVRSLSAADLKCFLTVVYVAHNTNMRVCAMHAIRYSGSL